MKTTPGVVAEVKNKMCLAEAHLIVVVCQKALSCFFPQHNRQQEFFSTSIYILISQSMFHRYIK